MFMILIPSKMGRDTLRWTREERFQVKINVLKLSFSLTGFANVKHIDCGFPRSKNRIT